MCPTASKRPGGRHSTRLGFWLGAAFQTQAAVAASHSCASSDYTPPSLHYHRNHSTRRRHPPQRKDEDQLPRSVVRRPCNRAGPYRPSSRASRQPSSHARRSCSRICQWLLRSLLRWLSMCLWLWLLALGCSRFRSCLAPSGGCFGVGWFVRQA